MIDFRSDTVTKPTKSMLEAITNAEVGDDVYEDDPTIKKLEQRAAELLGKEAALFVPSGTMGNQIAILAHTKRGDEIIIGKNSHIKNYEVGAAAVLASVSYHLVEEINGLPELTQIKKGIRGEDIHYPETSLICIENAHGTGIVGSLKDMEAIYNTAKSSNLNVHCDGARFFNAATALKTDAKTMAQYTDSVMFCLSKGLAAPIGSMLVGTASFIKKARKYRKMLGGGMRQVGILGAAGLISLDTMRLRLEDDHKHADYLAEQLQNLDGFEVDFTKRSINMVFIKVPYDKEQLIVQMKEKGILLGGYKDDYLRIVTHNDITINAIDKLIDAFKTIIN